MKVGDLISLLEDLKEEYSDEVIVEDEVAGLNKVQISSVYRDGDKIIIDVTDYNGYV